MLNFSTKELQLEDFPQLVALEELALYQYSDTPPDHHPPRWTLEKYFDCTTRGEVLRGLFDGTLLVAFYIFHTKEDELYVTRLAVHPEYRKQGLATYIMELAEKEAATQGLPKCALCVDPFNGRALSVYFKMGYIITAHRRGYFGIEAPHTDRFIMEKWLQEKKQVGKEHREVCVDNVAFLEQTLQEGFVGVALKRGENNKSNVIVFAKLR